ncbi:MAG: putative toxin-antitoxin system toxin component, PIN family [Kiritimatiellia bacterium]|nr:putative toxin-antitoxin system toxin component, PIN family [Kiritimatiellia bacterium]
MRIILDANVLIAAIAGRGLCESLLELCLEEHVLIVSQELLDEVSGKLIRKIKLPVAVVDDFCSLLRNNAILETPAPVAAEACRDPKDLYLLGLCEATRAEFLVTGDLDLIESGWRGITRIVTPRQFWEHCAQR